MIEVRVTIWKYFGAMFMEQKDGQLAVSFHRMLGLIMFVWCLAQWSFGEEVPEHAVYTLWMLIGLKMVSKVSDKFGVTKFEKSK